MCSQLKYSAGIVILVSFFTFSFAQVNWSINSPVKNISTVIWAGTQFVAVGTNGVCTSRDGSEWNSVIVNGFGSYNKAVWTGSKFFVYSDSTIQTSTNGTVWTSTPSPFNDYGPVLYEESLFVAIRNDELATSQDGITWTKRHSFFTADDNNSSLSYGNGIFVVTAYDSIFTSEDGIVWNGVYKMKEYSSKCVWNGSQFTVIGANGTILTSVNGTNWTEKSTFKTGVSSIIWTGKQFILSGRKQYSDQLFTSPDGIQWNSHKTPFTGGISSMVCSPDGHIVALSNGSLISSTNGIDWYKKKSGYYSTAIISNSDSWFIANKYDLLFSDDCLTWSAINTPIQSLTIKDIVSVGKDLMLLYNDETVQGATRIFTSTGNYNWKETFNFDFCKINSIANGTDKLIGVGRQGAVLCINGNEKIFCNSGTYSDLNSVIWTGTQFVAVGYSGVILISSDGISWSRKNVSNAYDLMSVIWTGTQLVAVGEMGTVITSSDGNSWTVQNSGVQYMLRDIACGPQNQLVAVGASTEQLSSEITAGIILSSSDGVNWVKRLTYNQEPFISVAYGDSQFAAVGSFGTIAIAPLSTSGSPVLKKTAAPMFNPQVTQNGITIELEAGNFEVSIIDMAGRNVFESRGSTLSPTRRSFLPELASNCYIVKLSQNGQVRKKAIHLKR